MELRGIEPLSENLSIAASPITVISLTFPPSDAKWQAADFSSFIGSFYPAKLWEKSASPIWRRWLRWWAARGRRAAIKLLTRNYRLRLILSSGLLRGPGPRMASPTSKSPSKPVQPRVVISSIHADTQTYIQYIRYFSCCQVFSVDYQLFLCISCSGSQEFEPPCPWN